MANVVGEAGVQAIRDFIKPLVIETTDISNTADIFNIWDGELSTLQYGYSNVKYTWNLDGAKINDILKWNFIEVTECTGRTILLHKIANRTYEGMMRASWNTYDNWKYILKINLSINTFSSGTTYQCLVFVEGVLTPYEGSAAVVTKQLVSLFSFSSTEINSLFTNLMSGNSFVFTKTQSNYSADLGADSRVVYVTLPLDLNGTTTGTIQFHFVDSNIINSGFVPLSLLWEGHSKFFNRTQTWYLQLATDGSDQTGTLILINNQDIAIQTISASDYASLSTKDPNVLYFIPEE